MVSLFTICPRMVVDDQIHIKVLAKFYETHDYEDGSIFSIHS